MAGGRKIIYLVFSTSYILYCDRMKGIRTDTQSWSLLHAYVSTVGIVVQKELKQLFRQQKVNDNEFCISNLRRYYYL